MTKHVYNATETRTLTGLSRERLRQLRSGHTARRKRKGGYVYEKQVAPQLEQETDWFWHRGKIYYTRSGLEKLMNRGK